jgi:hypothetical protein
MRRIYALLLLLFSCSNESSKKPEPSAVSETADLEARTQLSFPESSYDQVVLFRIKADKYKSFDHIMVEKEEGSATSPYTDGLAFIDSFGKPTRPYFDKYTLSKQQASELVSILQSPLEEITTTCIPIYRDVFVFYDNKKHQVAQAQICLGCGHLFLTTRKGVQSFQMNRSKEYERLSETIDKIRAS